LSRPESRTVVKGARRSLFLARQARKSGRGGGRSRILDEALRLFSTKGFSDVSMSDVADGAGVTKAAVYYHFRDKEDLYYQVALLGIERTRELVNEALAEEGTLEDRLIRASIVGFENIETNVVSLHMSAHEHLDQERHDALHRAMQNLAQPVVDLLATEVPPKPGGLSAQAGAALLGALGAAMTFSAAGSGAAGQSDDLPVDNAERAALVVRLFLHGYLGLARGE